MPDQIVIVFVAELKVYGFRGSEGVIAELLCILEKVFATGSGIARGERGSWQWIGGQIATICPWVVKDQIGFAAMCNDDVDHTLLAHLCLYFSESFSGIVDLNGNLQTLTSDESMLTDAGVRAATYVSASGRTCVSHFLLPSGLRRWCQHADFSMVK